MSRVGKHAVAIPSGVTVQMAPNQIEVKGQLGTLSYVFPKEVSIAQNGQELVVTPVGDGKFARAMWGTARSRVRNLVQGVSEGFKIELEINGVGYRAALQGDELVLQLGFSHEVRFPIPSGIKITCEKPTSISVFGADRQQVGEVAAHIRGFKVPEPYKGKGIKYLKETVFRKEGKKK